MSFSAESHLENESKRLFFAAQIKATWPQEFPLGRMILEETRHMTLAFIGNSSYEALETLLPQVPLPSFRVGLSGIGTALAFLPKEHARVVALDIMWLEDPHFFFVFQSALSAWLTASGYALKKQAFYPHITIARAPFDKEKWLEHFEPVPFYLAAIHLYESLGNLEYRSLWSHLLENPFTSIDHTADIAFEVCGESIQQLFLHAQLALFFTFPPLAQFYTPSSINTFNEIIVELNRMIAMADAEIGCAFKAVSFHGSIQKRNELLYWEMIVDV
ncbi:MAG TPA: hypothetical protein VGJ00_04890 [Rhabdochlamydiaceae bacterium]|jgi:2'-5' RNA ligase